MDIKTFLKSARQMIANKGDCNTHDSTHIYCRDCFYHKNFEVYNAFNDVCGECCKGTHGVLGRIKKHIRDAEAFIEKYEVPTYIEIEEEEK